LHFRRLGDTEYYRGLERKLIRFAEPLFSKLVKDINDFAPDAVVNLGDIIEHVNVQTDTKNLEKISSVLKQINAPLFSCVGNHEVINLEPAKVANLLGQEKPTFSADVGGHHLVFLSPSDKETDMPGGYKMKRTISDADLLWLKNDLKNNRLPTIVFTHFGLAKDDLAGNHWFGSDLYRAEGFLENEDAVKDVLHESKNLLCVFNGHHHWTKTVMENGIPYHTVGSLIEDTTGKGVPDGVWFKVEICGGKLDISEQHVVL